VLCCVVLCLAGLGYGSLLYVRLCYVFVLCLFKAGYVSLGFVPFHYIGLVCTGVL
jgi:hypothetical protein